MSKPPIVAVMIAFFLSLAGWPSTHLATDGCWGSQKAAAAPAISLDTNNEPLRGVLEKIYKTTGWQVKAPDKWLDRPVSQTLNNVTLEEGLRAVLKNAGMENLLLLYDENTRVVTLFDTESPQSQAARRPAAQTTIQPPFVSTSGEPDPILKRAAERAAGPAAPQERRRTRRSEEP